MQDSNNFKVRLIIVLVLSIVASFLMIIFTIPKAHALVMKYPDFDTTVNGTKYYGYSVPDRPNPSEFGVSLDLGVSARLYQGVNTDDFSLVSNGSYNFFESNNFHFDKIDNYIKDNNIDLGRINYNMTNPIVIDGPLVPRLMNYTWSFSMGNQYGGLSEMFSSGEYFDYNDAYSFTYDIVLFDSDLDNGHLGKYVSVDSSMGPSESTNYNGFLTGDYLNSSSIGVCNQPMNNNSGSWSCSSGNLGYGYQATKVYADDNLQVIKVRVFFNQYSKYKFSYNLTSSNNNNGLTNFVGSSPSTTTDHINYFNNVNNRILNKSSDRISTYYTYMFVSMPYEMIVWSTESSTFCQGNSCWTQADTDALDNNKESNGSGSFLDDILGGINGILDRNYGFSGIVNYTFGFINNLLTSMRGNNTCYVVSVKFFNKDIVIPCGSSFWGRSDMNTFNATYNLIFIGALSYVLCWKIYKDLLNVINPTSRVVNGSEVDSL